MKTVCLSENTNEILKQYLHSVGCSLIEIKKTDAVYDAIASHCDIYLCKVHETLIVAPEQLPILTNSLSKSRVNYIPGNTRLFGKYPKNISYNAAQIGQHLIHHTTHTDSVILEKARESGLILVHTKQGYTKCSLVVVDAHSAVTADEGLARVLGNYGIEALLITPGYVKLKGFSYGFLGGASGRVGDEIIFNGDLSAHPDFKAIIDFMKRRGLKPVWFPEYPLEDIGSILQIK